MSRVQVGVYIIVRHVLQQDFLVSKFDSTCITPLLGIALLPLLIYLFQLLMDDLWVKLSEIHGLVFAALVCLEVHELVFECMLLILKHRRLTFSLSRELLGVYLVQEIAVLGRHLALSRLRMRTDV